MLKGKNIWLRALEPSDVNLLYAWENDERFWHLGNAIAPVSRFILEQYVMSAENDIFTTKQLRLMIEKKMKTGSTTIGAIDLFDFDPVNMRAGLGILITEPEQRKGFASEALEMMINYCFNVLNLHQVYCNIGADNRGSLELFKKFNFVEVGIKKEWIFNKNKWEDEILLQLINK